MRYLKRLNESIEDDIKQDITEICFDLTDCNKFSIRFRPIGTARQVVITDAEGSFFYLKEDIEEVILRIKDYLGDRFIEFSCNIGMEWVADDDMEDIKSKYNKVLNAAIKYRINE